MVVTVAQQGIPLAILRNNGDGTFEDGRQLGGVADTTQADRSATTAFTATIGNLSGDAAPDIAFSNGDANAISVFRNAVFADARRVPLAVGEQALGKNFGVQPLVNQPPTINPIPDKTVKQDSGVHNIPLRGITPGTNEQQQLRIVATIQGGNQPIRLVGGQPTGSGVTYVSGDETGLVSFETVPGESGNSTVEITVQDVGFNGVFDDEDDRTVTTTFNVITERTTPDFFLVDDHFEIVASDGPHRFDVSDNDVLGSQVFRVINGRHGTVRLTEDREAVEYLPDEGFVGEDHFVYYANNGTGSADSAVVTVLVKTPQALPGDADRNGQVDFFDFLVLSSNFGLSNKTWEDGDFDENQTVDFRDFLVLTRNFDT